MLQHSSHCNVQRLKDSGTSCLSKSSTRPTTCKELALAHPPSKSSNWIQSQESMSKSIQRLMLANPFCHLSVLMLSNSQAFIVYMIPFRFILRAFRDMPSLVDSPSSTNLFQSWSAGVLSGSAYISCPCSSNSCQFQRVNVLCCPESIVIHYMSHNHLDWIHVYNSRGRVSNQTIPIFSLHRLSFRGGMWGVWKTIRL